MRAPTTTTPSRMVHSTSGVDAVSLRSAVGPNGRPAVRETVQVAMMPALSARPQAHSQRRGRTTISTAKVAPSQPVRRKNHPCAQSSLRCAGAKPKWMAAAVNEQAATTQRR